MLEYTRAQSDTCMCVCERNVGRDAGASRQTSAEREELPRHTRDSRAVDVEE